MGIPYGFVFTQLSEEIGENWTVTLSHEALELILDPEANLLVMGPHPDPSQNQRTVFHWYEACDAVQSQTYKIDDIEVSNFLLPLYFTESEEYSGRNDFLGRAFNNNQTLVSFNLSPGGYVGFYDIETNGMETYTLRGDTEAERRLKIKEKAEGARRAIRYQRGIHKEKEENIPLAQQDRVFKNRAKYLKR